MITLQDVKLQLRIDHDAEDALLRRFIGASERYVRAAVDNYVDNEATDVVRLALITEMYEHRASEAKDYNYIIQSMITQLRFNHHDC